MIKALNPESLNPDDITKYVKLNKKYLTGEALERAVAAETSKRKQENLDYKISFFANLVLILISFVGAVATIVNVFKGNWNYVAGFAIVTYAAFWVFRRIPWPMSRKDRSISELRAMMGKYL